VIVAGKRVGLGLGVSRTTVRWRLALLYGGLFLASGAALLAITYGLVEHATVSGPGNFQRAVIGGRLPPAAWLALRAPGLVGVDQRAVSQATAGPGTGAVRRLLRSRAGLAVVKFAGSEQRISDLHQLEVESAIALAIMAIIAAGLGWVIAGRVLGPLRTMTVLTREFSAANLDQRLAMTGPRDELRQLADTIDGLLERLQGAFDAQRRFVANASHELRTPLTTVRALLEMIISDPDATIDTFRVTCEQVLEESETQEQLIDALLTLAQGQRGIEHRDLIDLAQITIDVLRASEPVAAASGVRVDVGLAPALIDGDPRQIARLISNLLENAIAHNTPHGRVSVGVDTQAGHATLQVINTGPVIPAAEIDRLLQPFQRLTPERVADHNGLGLGLSIVAAIADAHHATLGPSAPA
jgi:signal transduction histidine kinase